MPQESKLGQICSCGALSYCTLRTQQTSSPMTGVNVSLQDLEYEGSMPLDSDTGSGGAAGAPKRRKRSQPAQPHFQYQ